MSRGISDMLACPILGYLPKGITLEEYIDSLDIGSEYDGYYITRQKKDEVLIPNSLDAVEISR